MEITEEIKFMEYYIENVIEDLRSSIEKIWIKYHKEYIQNISELDSNQQEKIDIYKKIYKLQVNEEIKKLLNKGEFELFMSISKKYYINDIFRHYYWDYMLNEDLKELLSWCFANFILKNMKDVLEKPFIIQHAGFDQFDPYNRKKRKQI
jgi:hypothetical protein